MAIFKENEKRFLQLKNFFISKVISGSKINKKKALWTKEAYELKNVSERDSFLK